MQYQPTEQPQLFRPPAPSTLTPQPGLDWVTGPSGSYGPDAHNAYPSSYGAQAGSRPESAFGSFDEEPPLLEGK